MAKKAVEEKKVRFEYMAPTAKKVVLTGDFNSWKLDGVLLKKDRNGLWKADLSFMPGRYQYKFIVDGQWRTDPMNRTVRNPFGTENSVKEVI